MCMHHQDQEILLLIYMARKMIHLYSADSRAARAAF